MSFIVFDVVSGHNHARCTLNGLCQYPFYIQYCTQNLKTDFAIFFVHRSGGIVILVICLHLLTFFKSNHAKDTIERFKKRVIRQTFCWISFLSHSKKNYHYYFFKAVFIVIVSKHITKHSSVTEPVKPYPVVSFSLSQ